jgi:hypothetical protein
MRKHGIGESLRKNELDQYYTSPTYASYLWNKANELLDIDSFDILLEPCAGTGSFFNLMDESRRIGLDINPKCEGVLLQDFLTWVGPDIPYGRILTMTNPPYGKNSNGAIKFFNTSAIYSDAIVVINPQSFRKESVHNRLDKSFHLIWEEDVPPKSFVFENEQVSIHNSVQPVAQIWVRKNSKRQKLVYHYKDFFKFVNFNADYDIAIRRIGYNAGKIYDTVNEEQKYQFLYIKCENEHSKNKIISLDFDNDKKFTGGGFCINRLDIIRNFMKT